MSTILSDKTIKYKEEDYFDLADHVDYFHNQYINSDYTGSVLLSGKWGIGKTSFLNLLKENASSNEVKKFKFIELDYWNEERSGRKYSFVALKTFPIMFFIIKFLPIILVTALAVIQFGLVLFKSSQVNISTNDIVIWIVLIIMSAVFSFIKDEYSSEKIFKFLLSYRISHLKNTKLIFVIDDFDRISSESKDGLYSLISEMNLFNHSLLIVVGEYKKLVSEMNDSIFFQKIFSNIEYVPIKLNSINVWEYFEEQLSLSLTDIDLSISEKSLFTDIRDLFVEEKRTVREANHLLNLFNRVYRKDKVNSSQQLALCYIYQYHNVIYEYIINNQEVIYSRNLIPYKEYPIIGDKSNTISLLEELENNQISIKRMLSELLYKLFNDEKSGFKHGSITSSIFFQRYQIESVEAFNTIDLSEVREIVEIHHSDYRLLNNVNNEGNFEEFYFLLKQNYFDNPKTESSYEQIYQSLLVNIIILQEYSIFNPKSTFTINYPDSIFYKTKDILLYNYELEESYLFETMIKENTELDISQKLKILPKYIPARSEEQTEKQKSMVREIFKENIEFTLLQTKYPGTVLYFYSQYKNEIDPEDEYTSKFKPLLQLEDHDLYHFIINHLSDKQSTGAPSLFRIHDYSYSEEFRKELTRKIESMEGDKRELLMNLIRNY
ncbi:P-loop NTPase fold protein [Salinicoccus sp. HZC-1]|uniref:P-loop NTPase fold protein n=1 Tax=Salinicoccus sp. HZC-1 TaxID=3385497 RepID=UPI00398B5E1B